MPVGSEFTQATQFRSPPSGMSSYIICPCRSMKLVYKEQGVFGGIPTFRFVAPSTLFANGSVYPPNEGFCPCRESGIQNVSTCRFSMCHPCWEGGRVWPVLRGLSVSLIPGLCTFDNSISPEIMRGQEDNTKKKKCHVYLLLS